MPIDAAAATGAAPNEGRISWTHKDVILYHLGLGAGRPPTDADELRYTYEKNLHVLPTFATVLGFKGGGGLDALPGIDIDLRAVLHGGQEVVVHHPLPPEADGVRVLSRVSDVWDKGKAAVIVLESSASLPDGTRLFDSRSEIFVRGEGGFGGERGPATRIDPPERDADHTVEVATRPDQALLYRLSGDWNPLHADPDFAKAAGFDTPILHGLCSYGLTLKAVVDTVLGGDVARVRRYRTKFAGVFFPGETMRVRVWDEGGTLYVRTSSVERDDAVVLADTVVDYAG
ncbi:3-alpha,7-alpha,12-alpha-trihydroxy-5-beta-cholest-24-enoyl-CoA hydratase [Yinghuangia sp. ASG 101]|uniref:MaoC/PaaZ C-terminal domain-containing protein n=1 Tax=Yinghuangia sp. ASG 101 TaxID=2896848 RepID=UPI001E3A58FF|nr:MaoC/PaaZ C-terminal domain-containing protein [Yinghuangia sp. ASG 101]UGQ13999.1 3-alpha,7-alpha,12-alpha-trihydroxy-5-beta-cholest-24-enoyl-CoA hydratase [Yinghuangia sp. ASG 101]